jgi:hypothetical protein
MENRISINEKFLCKILESQLIPEIIISKGTIKIPFFGSRLPDTILKLDKESIRIGLDEIECKFSGVAPLRIVLSTFKISDQIPHQVECRLEVYIKFLGEHNVTFFLRAFNLFKNFATADIKYSSDRLSINLSSYFPDELPIILERITVDHGLEIIWN